MFKSLTLSIAVEVPGLERRKYTKQNTILGTLVQHRYKKVNKCSPLFKSMSAVLSFSKTIRHYDRNKMKSQIHFDFYFPNG